MNRVNRSGAQLFIARSLRTVRAARDRTLVDLAAEIRIGTGALSSAESGHRLLTEQQLDTLAAALQVDRAVLLLDPDDVLRRAQQ